MGCEKETENKVPLADAGLSQSTTFPKDSVTLTGIASDEDGTITAYLWSQVSGPSASIIRNPGSTSTIVKFTTAGTFLFQLMAVDDLGATGVDTVSVVVTRSAISTLTLQPANNPNEKRIVNLNGGDLSSVGPDLPLFAWTQGGAPFTSREILSFDLSTIPQSAQIISANLYLYSHPAPINGNLVDANFGADNSFSIQQVIAPWNTASVTWFNTPPITTNNQVIIPHTSQSQLDLNLDVKAMISSMVNNNANYGFMLKLQNEVIYTSRLFVSSSNTDFLAKRPKLVVVYQQ
jgi:hypothetical protein